VAAAQKIAAARSSDTAFLPLEQGWLIALPSAPSAPGALDADRVYIPLQSKWLVALDRKTGVEAWTRDLDVVWPPVVSDGGVFVAARDGIHRLDPETGDTQQVATLPAPPTAPMTTAGSQILIPLESRALLALRTDGQILWQTRLDAVALTRAAAGANGVAYLALSDARVMAVALTDGRVLWSKQLEGTLSEPTAAGQRVFVGSTNKVFYALQAESGKREWYVPTGHVVGSVADEKTVYVLSLDNRIRALNRTNGNVRWQAPADIRAVSPPQLVDGALLVTGVRPTLATFDAKTGMPLGTFALEANLEHAIHDGTSLISPTAAPDSASAVLVMRDGRVLGLRRATKPAEKEP
jgi:outer membrane protein assembly factor BamB